MIITKKDYNNLINLPNNLKQLIPINRKGSSITFLDKENFLKNTYIMPVYEYESTPLVDILSKHKSVYEDLLGKYKNYNDYVSAVNNHYDNSVSTLLHPMLWYYHIDPDYIYDYGRMPEAGGEDGVVVMQPTYMKELIDAFPKDVTWQIEQDILNRGIEDKSLIYSRMHDIWKAAGRPQVWSINEHPYHIKGLEDRAYYYPYLRTMVIGDLSDFIEETAHPIQTLVYDNHMLEEGRLMNDDYWRELVGLSWDHTTGTWDESRYGNPDHFEYRTHQLVSPLVADYIYNGIRPLWLGKNGLVIGNVLRKIIYPKNRLPYNKVFYDPTSTVESLNGIFLE